LNTLKTRPDNAFIPDRVTIATAGFRAVMCVSVAGMLDITHKKTLQMRETTHLQREISD
jgi:hypothetical protein